MSADHSDHSHDVAADSGHDLAVEAQHAREHASENWKFFLGFFILVLLAVISYEFTANRPWEIALLAVMRCGYIGFFMFMLFKRFNYIVTAFIFTALFFIGMVFLSWWDSTIQGIGDPITDKNDVQVSHPH
jgi:heme/copper-type cytochrome/quinol oxidase subunit 4